LTRYRRDYDKRIWLKRSELDAIFKPKRVEAGLDLEDTKECLTRQTPQGS